MFLFIAQQQAGAGQTKITSSMWRNTVDYGEWGFAPCRVKQLRSVSNLDPQSKQNLINKQQTTSMQSNQTQPPPKKTHNSQTYPHLQGTKWTLKETLPYPTSPAPSSPWASSHTVDASEIRRSPVEVGSLSHYLQGSIYPRWCRISSINSIIQIFSSRLKSLAQPTVYTFSTH